MAKSSWRSFFDLRRFFAGEPAVEGHILLTHRRVFILPNRRGGGLFLLLLLQLLASINYSNNLGFILTFLLGSVAVLGTLYGFRNLAGLTLRTRQPSPVFAGDAASFHLIIDNPTATPRISLQAGLRGGLPQNVNLTPGESLTVTLSLTATRRGWLELPVAILSSEFPLGLFRVWSPLRFKQKVLVYPRPAPEPIPFPAVPGGVGGLAQATDDDFHGFQSYQPGDSMRRIHWKGVAKGQGVKVKEYRGEASSQLYLDWLQTPGFDVEARLSRLCRWALDAEQAGLSYGLRLPGTDLKPSSGQAHLRACLERLAVFGIPS